MKIIGLTGGIGMGKSTASATFRRHGVPIFDADQAVHALQAVGGRAVRPIEAAFPGTTRGGAVDREALRRAVLGTPAALKQVERIVHPLVKAFSGGGAAGGEIHRGAGYPFVVGNRWRKAG